MSQRITPNQPNEAELPSLAPRAIDPPADAASGGARPRGARRGDVIGERYRVEGQLGRGGMGRVLQVRHCVLGKAFALKLPQRRQIASPQMRERFHREARLASSLSHENICSVIDFGEDPRFGLFMVMELLEGIRLDYKVRRDGALPIRVAVDVILQVADAVRYVHECGIIHGDIKSENILLTRNRERRRSAKLLDFGLARPDTRDDPGHVEGTPEYLAPERILRGPASPQSDIYALGILFWECLVGALPFTGSTEAVLDKQLHERLPPPSSRLERPLDERADLIVLRATARRPEERHPDLATLLYELRTLAHMVGVEPRRARASGRLTGAPGAASRPEGPQLSATAELFEHSPVPLASVDATGTVRVANRAFRAFLGHAGNASGIRLGDTSLVEYYPALEGDLAACAADGIAIRRTISIPQRSGDPVDVLVTLAPAPRGDRRLITAGDVYVSLQPLGRTSA